MREQQWHSGFSFYFPDVRPHLCQQVVFTTKAEIQPCHRAAGNVGPVYKQQTTSFEQLRSVPINKLHHMAFYINGTIPC